MALSTAVTWAVAVVLFKKSGEIVHPVGLNLFKNVLATLLFLPTMWLWGEALLRPVPIGDYLLVLVSGALGIGIADTLFFKCLNTLGASLTAIIDCLYSPFTIGLSMLWLGESLSTWQLVGAILVVSAVLTVTRGKNSHGGDRRTILLGVLWGVLSVAAMAVGIVMVKPLLDRSPLLWVTEVRLLGGVAVLLAVLLFHPSRRNIVRSIVSRQRWIYTLSGSFIGAYVSMILWLAGMKYTQVSVAAVLNQTNNVFIFILAALFLREKTTILRVIGIVLGVGGTILVTFG
ncbi:MAG TPA: DMT family transporter [Acidobacteriota bacterium]|nr:DMT family transporter [Acidobacteriota bacterium]